MQEPAPKDRTVTPAGVQLSAEIQQLYVQRSTLVSTFRYAFDGILRTLVTQRNMKIHWVSGLAVMLVGMALALDIAARASLIFCVIMVLCLEILNTALESFVDLHVKEYARPAMVAKDAAAASVLVLALGAVVVFADILVHRWEIVVSGWVHVRQTIVFGVPLLAAIGLMLFLPRRVGLVLALGAVAVACVAVLAFTSEDEVFSLGALSFVAGAVIARLREPHLLA